MIFRDNDFQDMDSGIMYIRDFELRDFVRNPSYHIIHPFQFLIFMRITVVYIVKKKNF